nr:uncharacterized protein LOC131752164 isoform X2 [Kogia breviceps]
MPVTVQPAISSGKEVVTKSSPCSQQLINKGEVAGAKWAKKHICQEWFPRKMTTATIHRIFQDEEGSSGVLSLLFALNQEDGHHSIAVCKWDSESVLRNKQNYACFPNDEAPRLGRKPLRLCARTFSAPWGPRKWSSGPQVTMALPRPALHSSWSLGGSGAIESWCSPQVFMPCPCGQSWPSHPDATPPPLPRPPLAQSTPLFNSSRHSHPRFPLEPTDGSLSPASGA